MGIRVEHGSVADFAALGKLAGEAQRAEKEAERADRQRLAAMEMQQRSELQAMEIATKVGMAQDAMMFEREQADARRRFQMGMQFQSEANEFEREERKKAEALAKQDATIAAIDARDDYSDKEKEDMKMMFLANEEIPQRAVYEMGAQTELAELNKVMIMSDRLDKQRDRAQAIAAQFEETSERGGFLWLKKGKKYTRQVGKTKRDASEGEVEMYQRAVQEMQEVDKRQAMIGEAMDKMLGGGQEQEAVDLVTLTENRPDSEAERKAVYQKMMQAGQQSAAEALFVQWEKEEEEEDTAMVNNNRSNYRIPKRTMNPGFQGYGH